MGEFKGKEDGAQIASKLIIATAAVHKYPDDEPELWTCLIEMLKWSLTRQSLNQDASLNPQEF